MKLVFNMGGIVATLFVDWTASAPYNGNNLEIHHAVHPYALELRIPTFDLIKTWQEHVELILKGKKL